MWADILLRCVGEDHSLTVYIALDVVTRKPVLLPTFFAGISTIQEMPDTMEISLRLPPRPTDLPLDPIFQLHRALRT